jgi:hypothetical protein
MAARRALTAALALAAVGAALPALAQSVPAPLGLMVMLKVLTYDAAFASHGSGPFVVAVPFAPGQSGNADDLVTAGAALSLRSVNGRELKFVSTAAADLAELKGATAVLLPAGLAPEVARQVLQLAAKARLYSMTLDEGLVHGGALLGVAANAGRPQVLLNVTTARSLGVDLDPAVLKVARTVQ